MVYLIKKIIDELTVINSRLKELNNLKNQYENETVHKKRIDSITVMWTPCQGH